MKKHAPDGQAEAIDIIFRLMRAPNVREQPTMALRSWRVIADQRGDQFLFGLHPDSHRLRMSTAIVDVDLVQRRFMTSSGRVYWLHSEPGEPFGETVLDTLTGHHGLAGPAIDVTGPVWQALLSALQ